MFLTCYSNSNISTLLPVFPTAISPHFVTPPGRTGIIATPDPGSHAAHRTYPSCTGYTLFLQQRDECVWLRASFIVDMIYDCKDNCIIYYTPSQEIFVIAFL